MMTQTNVQRSLLNVQRFAQTQSSSEPLVRLLRIDLATGLVTVIKPEAQP